MFGAIVRGTVVLVAGSFIAIAVRMAGEAMIDAQEGFAPEGSTNLFWAETMVQWFPALIICAIVTLLIGSAIVRRRRIV